MRLLIILAAGALLGACGDAPPSDDASPPVPGPVELCEHGGIPHPDYGCPPFGEPGPAPAPEPVPEPTIPPQCGPPVPTTDTGEPCYGDFHAPFSDRCVLWRAQCLRFYPAGGLRHE